MLVLVYTFSSMDRLLIGVIAQPIIDEFRLQDWEFGLLSGFGFMVTYTLAGIPIARLAERRNRVRIIAVSLFAWSVMTMLCGVAWGFLSLLLFRVGVGIGEAGCVPPANSFACKPSAADRTASTWPTWSCEPCGRQRAISGVAPERSDTSPSSERSCSRLRRTFRNTSRS